MGVTLVCPGPIAGDDTRSVFGAHGKFIKDEKNAGHAKKVSTERCCDLVCRAAAFGVQEAWIARHPVLFVGYLAQYFPFAAEWLLQLVGPGRARALKQGKSGYSFELANPGKKST